MTFEADRVLSTLDVSRETSERLKVLAALLEKWNPRINLVSKSTISALWTRHILDSAQIFNLATHPVPHWVDIGSGGGFPGLVIAIMAAETQSPAGLTMIESDHRKCTFLRTVLRETGVSATVITDRIEKAAPQSADILSARALADLTALFSFTERHLRKGGTALFPKGANWEKEVRTAQESWSFNLEVIQSITEPEAVILKVGDLERV
ncbi:16S rRNA (guanine(527)-N(7))-methyltransferase RsmG [Shimia aestuarii]|uniref:Ribosomal RNA small subunit methyltransferase G n=1 Tax=Shimia aestuarii TaxID=254406 RepID=A0A1I4KID2_9RHOB|nr:16S rRNA (guanine(527)-N(7))-methyltransferase RsmG [Shimia aestuarii]SFL78266.1 16S rRNA (guanine527-N7)-methyltransferase [Shimia aestuarii]